MFLIMLAILEFMTPHQWFNLTDRMLNSIHTFFSSQTLEIEQ